VELFSELQLAGSCNHPCVVYRIRLVQRRPRLTTACWCVGLLTVLVPACDEYNKLTDELEVERACRTEAEKFASEVC